MARKFFVSCGACRVQRRKCSQECVLAPHFPADDPDKFTVVQKVFGTRNIVKLLQGVEAEQREDAVISMVYEASARVNDPIYGCATEVYQLQKQIAELESLLVATQAELKDMQSLVLLLRTGSLDAQPLVYPTDATSQPRENIMHEEMDPFLPWESLWEV